MRKGPIIILIGIMLLIVGTVAGMVTVVADDTPPLYDTTDMLPRDGETYTVITTVVIRARDPESGIQAVRISIDGELTHKCLKLGTVDEWNLHEYEYAREDPINNLGTHTFEWKITNNVGLITRVTGTYTIYTDLQGTWYVNDQAITGTTQTLYVPTLTLNFRFVKTQGIEDSKITCTATWSGPETGTTTLPWISAGTWEGSNTFGLGGSYAVTLTANDGIRTITFSILSIGLGGEEPWLPPIEVPSLHPLQWLGLATTGLGAIVMVVERAKKKS